MAFNDFAQAIQFGAGLLHGFNKQTDDIRAQHDKQQLELLKLLSSDKSQDVQSIDPGEVVGSQGFFGGGALKTKDGHPAFKVGGNVFAVKKRTPFMPADTGEAADLAPAAPVQSLEEDIPSGPEPAPAGPSAPGAPA